MTLCEVVKTLHAWTPEEKNAMRRVLEYGLRTWPDLIHGVRELQGQLILNAENAGVDFHGVVETDLRLVQLAKENRYEEALDTIAGHLLTSVEKLWPDCDVPRYKILLKQQAERRSKQSKSATGPAISH